MAKKETKPKELNCRLGRVGGQAVLEGVMMRSGKNYTTAVRVTETGEIVRDRHVATSVSDKYRILKLPLLRGVTNFIETMKLSFSTLTFSAEAQGLEEEPQGKFETWLVKTFGERLMGVVATLGTVLGLCLAVVLFMWLPTVLAGLLVPTAVSRLGNALVQGLMRVIIFVAYISLTGLMPDLRRTYEYHGAEHKSIFCYERGLELTVENVRKQSRFHPRCGTSFLFVMVILGIFITILLNFIPLDFLSEGLRGVVYTALKLLTLPFVVGLGYEVIRFAGRHTGLFVRIITAPGLWMQRITTREPDDRQIEVALVALKSALVEEFDESDVFSHVEGAPSVTPAEEAETPAQAAEEPQAPQAE